MTQAFNLSQLANNLNTSGQLDATDGLTGAVPVANGGTGLTSVGTSGNVLTSNGTAWVSSPPSGGSPNVQSFTSSGTWTKPSSGQIAMVVVIGGGGGGPKIDNAYGVGGFSSLPVVGYFLLSDLTSTVSVTIGSGGAGATSFFGISATGGNTTFGSYLKSYGGMGRSSVASDGSIAQYPTIQTETNSMINSSAIAVFGGTSKIVSAFSPYGYIANQIQFQSSTGGLGLSENAVGGFGGSSNTGGNVQNWFATGGTGSGTTGGAGTGYGAGGGAGRTGNGGAGSSGYCKIVVW